MLANAFCYDESPNTNNQATFIKYILLIKSQKPPITSGINNENLESKYLDFNGSYCHLNLNFKWEDWILIASVSCWFGLLWHTDLDIETLFKINLHTSYIVSILIFSPFSILTMQCWTSYFTPGWKQIFIFMSCPLKQLIRYWRWSSGSPWPCLAKSGNSKFGQKSIFSIFGGPNLAKK